MKKRYIILLLVVLLVINVTALAALAYNRWVRPPGSTDESGSGDPWSALQKEVTLSPEQLGNLRARRDFFRNSIQSVQEELAGKRIELLEEIRKARPDITRIDQMIESMSRLQSDIQKQTVRNLLEDKQILSGRQRERYLSLFLDQARAQGRGRGSQVHGRRGQRGRNFNKN